MADSNLSFISIIFFLIVLFVVCAIGWATSVAVRDKYERNFMAYCTSHGDTYEKCEELLQK